MKKILVLGAHQSLVGDRAGGYVRLKQFLKYKPSKLKLYIVDISPSIYDEQDEIIIEAIVIPEFLQRLSNTSFFLHTFIERLVTCIWSYKIGRKIIKDNDVNTIYVPIAEFLHLFLPAVLLKICYPHINLVVDILNFENIHLSFIDLTKEFSRKGYNIFTSIILTFAHKLTYLIHRISINYADYVITVSPFLVRELSKVYKKDTIDYTPSGVSIPDIRNSFNNNKKFLAVYMGRVTEQKGMFNLVFTWKDVIKTKPNAQLAIAGIISEIDRTALEMEIKKNGLKNNIMLFGEVDEAKKNHIIQNSEIFLHLANYEPLFPVIGVLEGLALGLPVITFNYPTISKEDRQIANKSDFINIVSNNKIKDVVKVIQRLSSLNDPEKEKNVHSAISYAKKFEWKEIAAKEFNIILNQSSNSNP
jgi:glycosyltransferase involved in cell wall biosynthesis